MPSRSEGGGRRQQRRDEEDRIKGKATEKQRKSQERSGAETRERHLEFDALLGSFGVPFWCILASFWSPWGFPSGPKTLPNPSKRLPSYLLEAKRVTTSILKRFWSLFGIPFGTLFSYFGLKSRLQKALIFLYRFRTFSKPFWGPLDWRKQAFRMILSSFLKDPPFSKKGAKMVPKWSYLGIPWGGPGVQNAPKSDLRKRYQILMLF